MTETLKNALAVDGGTPACSRPLPKWPVFESDEIEAATRTLATGRVNYWTGQEGLAFEREFAAAVGVKHGIALANGTLALELALRALGIGPGDEVIVPARTFIASASCVAALGARPVVADIDPDSQNLTVRSVDAVAGPRSRAIVAVHLGGWPCDMDALMDFARARGLKVVEDCAQAHGATVRGRAVGSFGDCAAFSFCQDKIMTTGGEGGMLVTSDAELWRLAWRYKDHGKTVSALEDRRLTPEFRWLHEEFGSNYRMTEMQAAIGRVQLTKLADWVAKRQRNAQQLAAMLGASRALRVPEPQPDFGHAYYRLYAFVRPGQLRPDWNRTRIIEALWKEGVPCSVGSCGEIYREQAFVRNGFAPTSPLSVAAELAETSLAFPVHPTLTKEDVSDIGHGIAKVLRAASV
jgi:dTDP-4-amino-4,6-dideoxygalactose transaminase